MVSVSLGAANVDPAEFDDAFVVGLRSPGQPSHRLRRRRAPLPGVTPGTPRAASDPSRVAPAHPRVRAQTGDSIALSDGASLGGEPRADLVVTRWHDGTMKIVSMVPSATEILFALGLGDEVKGVSSDCDYPPAARSKPVVSGSALTLDEHQSARRVDRAVTDRVNAGQPIYTLDAARVEAIQPESDPRPGSLSGLRRPFGRSERGARRLGLPGTGALPRPVDPRRGHREHRRRRGSDRDCRAGSSAHGRVAGPHRYGARRGGGPSPAADARPRMVRPPVLRRPLGAGHGHRGRRRAGAERARGAVSTGELG